MTSASPAAYDKPAVTRAGFVCLGLTYLPEAILAVLHDSQGVVGSLAFAVEFNVAC